MRPFRSQCRCPCHNGKNAMMHIQDCCVPDPEYTGEKLSAPDWQELDKLKPIIKTPPLFIKVDGVEYVLKEAADEERRKLQEENERLRNGIA